MSTIQAIIRNGDAEALVKYAEDQGKALHKKYSLKTNQIRSVFSRVRQIEAKWDQDKEAAKRQLQLLKPRLAYRAAKEKGQGVKQLRDILTPAVDEIFAGDPKPSNEVIAQRFEHFVQLFEALLAYHRAAGGR